MATNNAINLNAQGLAYYDGSGTFLATSLTQHDVIVASTNNNITGISCDTDGKIVIGSASGAPAFASLTSSGTIEYTTGANTLALNARAATTSATGVVELSDDTEAVGTSDSVVMTPGTVGIKLGSQTSKAIPYGAGTTAALSWTAALTQGQFLFGGASGTPTTAALTAGSGMTIDTSTAGTVSLSVSAGGINWNVITDDVTASVNNGYIANDSTDLPIITLPGTAAVGDIVRVGGLHANKFRVKASLGDTIKFGDQTSGSGGNIQAQHQYDAVSLICVVPDTTWAVLSSVGNFELDAS